MRAFLLSTVGILLTLGLVILSHPAPACYDRSGRSAQKRFILKGDEAIDNKTGLTWKRCSLGTKSNGGHGCAGEKAFVTLDQALRSAMAGTCRPGQSLKA
jgi:hypothetical protein